jgi:hypothetical protein
VAEKILEINYRPIDKWPGEQAAERKYSPFRGPGGKETSFSETLNLLERELWFLGARNVVFQIALREEDFKLNGEPRANAKASHPGVIIAFDSKYGPLKYATDTFTTFQANVRAIALGLEALRKVDRYGITKRGEQYTGWKALPASTDPPFTIEQAAKFLATVGSINLNDPLQADDLIGDPIFVSSAYRTAAKRMHPDVGGSVAEFQRLQEAKRVLDAHHGGGAHV